MRWGQLLGLNPLEGCWSVPLKQPELVFRTIATVYGHTSSDDDIADGRRHLQRLLKERLLTLDHAPPSSHPMINLYRSSQYDLMTSLLHHLSTFTYLNLKQQ